MNENTRTPRRRPLLVALTLLGLGGFALSLTGCRGSDSSGRGGKLKVAYLGLTCEAPIFAALEKGFFKAEGLDVELVRTDWDGLRDGLGQGRFDANHTLIMYLLGPLELGMDVKITGGIHTGCLRLQVAAKELGLQADDLSRRELAAHDENAAPAQPGERSRPGIAGELRPEALVEDFAVHPQSPHFARADIDDLAAAVGHAYQERLLPVAVLQPGARMSDRRRQVGAPGGHGQLDVVRRDTRGADHGRLLKRLPGATR